MSRQKKNKKICAVIAAFSASMLLGISAYADTTNSAPESVPNSQTTQTTTTAATTAPAPSTTAATTTQQTESKPESSPESKPSNGIPENPFLSGMLSDDELYEYIADYLNVGSSLDTDGSAVLIGEDVINKNESNTSSADSTAAEAPSSAGEKIMYTVAAKDGSTFYIIIDKGAGGENVYFLNKVDIVDLASLIGINKDKDKLTAQEKQIVAAANGITVSQLDETLKDDNGNNSDTESNNTSKPNSSEPTTSKPTQTAQKDDTIMYIIIGGAFLLAVIIGYYVKVVKKKKEKGFDEQDDYDEENTEEYINEDDE